VCLSGVLSRDQILRLGYFTSISRVNRRLHDLCETHLLRSMLIPFHCQRLYVPGSRARAVVGDRIAAACGVRSNTPRFIQHALAVNDVRIALTARGTGEWRFEQQVRDQFQWANRTYQLRPDGASTTKRCIEFVEVDLGNVSLVKFSRKLRSYAHYLAGSRFGEVYGEREAVVLVVTTGKLRLSHLAKSVPTGRLPVIRFVTFVELGTSLTEGWS
jgi:hypothetical protein